MTGRGDALEADSIELLFFTVAGVRFGVDIEQVEHMAVFDGVAGDDTRWAHQLFGLPAPVEGYRQPTVIRIRTDNGSPYRVVIDALDDLQSFPLQMLTPFPALLDAFVRRCGLWCVLQHNGRLVLLVDFHYLADAAARLCRSDRHTEKEYLR